MENLHNLGYFVFDNIYRMIRLFLIFLTLFPMNGIAQKFMIKDGDTLPFVQTMEINIDTLYIGDVIFYPGDTTYTQPCQTFEKRNERIINITTTDCQPIGFWIIDNEDGSVSNGYYNKWGMRKGIWKTFDPKGKLINQIEYASFAEDTYVLREVNYIDGQEIVVFEKPWFVKFYLKNTLLIMIIILGTCFMRIPLNMAIAKRQFGQKPVFWIPFVTSHDNAVRYMIRVMYTVWWSKLDQENKYLGRISNLLSLVAIGGFLGVIVGLAISGELS